MTDDVRWVPEAATGFERGSRPWPSDRQFQWQRKVHWLALAQLARTGMHAIVSRTFGQYNDRREQFDFAPRARHEDDQPAPTFFDHSQESTTAFGAPDDPYWFDFVADIGDGFNATFAVAEQLAREEFVLPVGCDADPDIPRTLPRGRLLVMGGDEVYPLPTASAERDAYRDRLVGPYEAALQFLRHPSDAGRPDPPPVAHLYAIPGNHDWYDGLGAFIKRFCSSEWIGAWKTQQRRSYFAIELPHRWWVWGIDVAFEGPMDAPQLRYFKEAAERVRADDGDGGGRIILCTAYPRWLEPGGEGQGPYSVIRGFLHQALGADAWRVRLMLSGDSHFYARHSPVPPQEGTVKIVSGGGGAYLSGTQSLEPRVHLLESRDAPGPATYELAKEWPSQGTAKGTLSLGALLRVWRHWSVSALIAVLYLVLAGIARVAAAGGVGLQQTIARVGGGAWGDTFTHVVEASIRSATFWIFVGVLWVALAGLALAPQRGEKITTLAPQWLWGLGHAAAHVAAVLAITTTALDVAHGLDAGKAGDALCYYGIVLVGGYLVGTTIFAAYLVVAQLAKRSVWALFPLLAHEGWKNFLRIRVTDESVTVYALGLRRVPKHRSASWDRARELHVPAATSEWTIIEHVDVARGPAPERP
jgi:hypothetical protein